MKQKATTGRRARFFLIGAVIGVLIGGLAQPLARDMYSIFAEDEAHQEAANAWQAYTRQLTAIGTRILEDDFPNASASARAENFRQLGRLAASGLRLHLDNADPDHPTLFQDLDDQGGWGGPNADNKYLSARLNSRHAYRLRGDLSGLDELAIQTAEGDVFAGQTGVSKTLHAADLASDTDGKFELCIATRPFPKHACVNWLELDPKHTRLLIRSYFFDWSKPPRGRFDLHRIGAEGRSPPMLEEEELARRITEAGRWLERTIIGWKRFMQMMGAGREPNQATPLRSSAGGSSSLLYGSIPFQIEADQALLISFTPPQARYWSIQSYSQVWFDSGDYANRLTSLNHTQARPHRDGKVWLALAARDPGIHNWLDSEGRERGLLLLRWLDAQHSPEIETQLVDFDRLNTLLPEDLPRIDETARRRQIASRQRHVQQRFHN